MEADGGACPPSRSKGVFFDFDGVLTLDRTGSLTTLRYLSNATGIAYPRLRDAFRIHNRELNLGSITHAAIWDDVCGRLGAPLDPSLLTRAFESTPLNTGMLELACCLRTTCAVGIITDNKKDRMDRLREHAGLAALFDPIVVSAEVGHAKDGTRIFEIALARAGLEPRDAIFIDNDSDNLLAPRALGMATIHFDDRTNDVEGLASTLERMLGRQLPDFAGGRTRAR